MKMILKPVCRCCMNEVSVEVEDRDYLNWVCGDMLIQDALPTLTPNEREMLISGTCEECWNRMFSFSFDSESDFEEEDEEDYYDELWDAGYEDGEEVPFEDVEKAMMKWVINAFEGRL